MSRTGFIPKAIVVGAFSAALFAFGPAVANAAPVTPTPGPGDHVGEVLTGGQADPEAQQPSDNDNGWVNHRDGTGAQCEDRGVICSTGIWYPDGLQRQGDQDEGTQHEWVQLPNTTGADCENAGVVCGSTAS